MQCCGYMLVVELVYAVPVPDQLIDLWYYELASVVDFYRIFTA